MSLQMGKPIQIESYKHDGHIHRIWKESILLQKGDPVIVANDHPEVLEADGTQTSFPSMAVCFFYAHQWFHPVFIFDQYHQVETIYVDIASPYKWMGEKRLAYIDYDLDLIMKPNGSYRWVDQEEYQLHANVYQYPPSVKQKIKEAQLQLETAIDYRLEPFALDCIQFWCEQYRSLKKENDKKHD